MLYPLNFYPRKRNSPAISATQVRVKCDAIIRGNGEHIAVRKGLREGVAGTANTHVERACGGHIGIGRRARGNTRRPATGLIVHWRDRRAESRIACSQIELVKAIIANNVAQADNDERLAASIGVEYAESARDRTTSRKLARGCCKALPIGDPRSKLIFGDHRIVERVGYPIDLAQIGGLRGGKVVYTDLAAGIYS